MSKAFWAGHSIKQSVQEPATPASMTRALRGTRKDVSNMTSVELATRMNNEAHLRARIRTAEGQPAVKPTSLDYDRHLASEGTFTLADTRVPADATRVTRRKP